MYNIIIHVHFLKIILLYFQNMTRSSDTLTKSSATDYKKMMSDGSIESMDMDKSTELSYDVYGTQTLKSNENGGNQDILQEKYDQYAHEKNRQPAKVYGIPEYKQPRAFELSYRNEGFKDNSTRANSVDTILNEENPVIEDSGSDYYGNSSTLPLRSRGDLSFLSDVKNPLPVYDPGSSKNPNNTSFLPTPPPVPRHEQAYANTSFGRKLDTNNSPYENSYHVPEIRKTSKQEIPADLKRPDSYYTAVRSSKQPQPLKISQPPPPVPLTPPRPKAIYQSEPENKNKKYSRSKSEALLETNFDDEEIFQPKPLSEDNRSHSQPLETEF